MAFNFSSIKRTLSKPTSFFGSKLWVAIIICIIIALFLVLIFTFIFTYWRRFRIRNRKIRSSGNVERKNLYSNCSMDRRLLSRNGWDIEMSIETPEKQVMYSDHYGVINGNGDNSAKPVSMYTLREIEAATDGLSYENVIGRGQYGVVFQGCLMDDTQVAVKKLFNYSSEKKVFVREAEEMLLIRHRNLVNLMGYCAEEKYRMLVYEYLENGDLSQWLHRCISNVSPLTWDIRMKIIIGIAKGLAYLHEDTEPPIVHHNLKSSNILLDQEWNPKISDVGITTLLGPATGMSGYIAPEYDSTHALDEKSDVYSFGILIMEIVSGQTTITSTVDEIEEYLVDWVKSMIAEKNYDIIVDPKLIEMPSAKELKRILLIALRCVDFEVEKRPKIGEVIHMLEPRDLLLIDGHGINRHSI